MEWMPVAGLVLAIGVGLGWPVWYLSRVRRKRRVDASYESPRILGIVDELYHPDAHAAAQIHEVAKVLPAPAPLPGDPVRHGGRISIEVAGTVASVPAFSTDVVAAVLRHMNTDHPDDNALITRAFGSADAHDALMVDVDATGGTWTYLAGGMTHRLVVPWTTTISERAEIRREVVVTYQRACEVLGISPRDH